MSQQLINRSPDLKRLRAEGYEIEVRGGYLIIHHVPYVNDAIMVQYGKLITSLTINNSKTAQPDTHVINFMGDHPCHKDGKIITEIQHASPNQALFEGITLNHSFSNKPASGYSDYYHKVARYIEIISGPAKALDSSVTAQTFKVLPDIDEETVFQYIDTNSSRANIYPLNEKFRGQKIAIVGMGGTGSYVLDQVAKIPVDEIHIFDKDVFQQHNAFRAPGAAPVEQFDEQEKKVDYFTAIYSRVHKGIKPHPVYITADNIHLLKVFSYVFLCVDKNSVRNELIARLLEYKIPFIDAGIGVTLVDDKLIGTVRVTTGTEAKKDHLSMRIGNFDGGDNEYSNIQIADLNALNALLAVIKWKKLSGFYQDLKEEHHSTYTINTSQLLNSDEGTDDPV